MVTYGDYAKRKVEEMKLGMAKKQAVEYLKTYPPHFSADYEEQYKKTVKNFYNWNAALDKEILGE